MAIKLNLDSSMILEKQFSGKIRGYDAYQVDAFMDVIISDYRTIENNYLMSKEEIDALKEKVNELEKKCSSLEIENNKYKTKVGLIKDTKNVSIDNLELMKKNAALEKFCWEHGYDPNKIK